MPRNRRLVPGWLLSGSLIAGGLFSVAVAPRVADAGVDREVVAHQHRAVSGDVGFALGIRADRPRTAESIHHVILVDTSASQVGQHRDHGLAVLDAMLGALPASDRVQVFAYDVEPVALTRGFVSPETARNVSGDKLSRRVPAGAGNMLDAIKAASSTIDGIDAAAITVIGDGMSVAKLMQPKDLDASLSALRANGVAVHAYGVGSNIDVQVLGILAQQTGGVALVDKSEDADEVGHRLSSASRELPTAVLSVRLGDADGELLAKPLPIRSDRQSYQVGIGQLKKGDSVQVTTADSGAQNIRVGAVSNNANDFLVAEINKVDRIGGVMNGLAGESIVNKFRQNYLDQIDALEVTGRQAVESGDFSRAESIAGQLAMADPGNRHASEILDAVSTGLIPVFQDAPAPGAPELNVGDTVDLEGRAGERQIGAISEVEERLRLRGEKLSLAANRTIQEARELLQTDPESARAVLQQMRGAVKSAGDIEPELQEQLLRRLNFELTAVSSKEESLAAKQQSLQEIRAEIEAQERVVESLTLEEERLKQLSEQVRALMAQGYAGDSGAFEQAEAVARVIVEIRPGNATGAAALFNAEAAGQLDKAFRLRALRADRFLETLYQVELSHVPFPDYPPVVYPSAAEWTRKTELREKWRSVNLHQNSPNEARIIRALDSDAQVEFIDQPLNDAIRFLGEFYDIPIKLKEDALGDVGITPDEPITELVLSGVKLRNVLNIICEDEIGDLTYYIKDEVLWISSIDDANASGPQTRVYPVADLVIPIQAPQSGGGGLGGAGGGLGGGGLGGGGGGLGGGGLGGGGLGGGGGFFAIPSGNDVSPMKKKAVN